MSRIVCFIDKKGFAGTCSEESAGKDTIDCKKCPFKKKFEGKVEIRPIVGGSMNEQPFFKGNKYKCPNAKTIHSLGFYIPNNPDLTSKEINLICKLLK